MNNNFKKEFINFFSQKKYITENEYLDFIDKYKNILNDKHYIQLKHERIKYIKKHNNLYLNCVLKEKKEYFDNMFKEKDLGVDYKYLIIDEYQDISSQRYNLTSLLAKLYDAKIMAVGDDWQTIYSFAGANISLFKDFKKYVENAKRIPIKNTYRNSQELIDIAGNFVQKNKYQIKKKLKSNKHLLNPVELYYYDDSNKFVEDYNCAKTISEIIAEITSINPKHKILLLGRYNKDKDLLLYTDFFTEYRGKLKSKIIQNADITFLTIHKSKGLGYDDVILINGADKLYGFPSKVEDYPIIKLLKNVPDEMIRYPEERRLFYVAMTRTKNKFYITIPNSKKSIFVKEITKYNNVLEHKKVIKYDTKIKTSYKCPKCNSNLYMINYKKSGFNIYKCNNNGCTFQTMFPKLLEELEICPLCNEIITYRYTNKNNERIYKCINAKCDYLKIKKQF